LQVGKDGDGFVKLQRSRAQNADAFGVICVRAVGEVEASHVHTGAQ
jgi:hypothetical protein